MIDKKSNCNKCTEFINKNCNGIVSDCMCKLCPRNLAECLVVRYCRETESVLYTGEEYYEEY